MRSKESINRILPAGYYTINESTAPMREKRNRNKTFDLNEKEEQGLPLSIKVHKMKIIQFVWYICYIRVGLDLI